MSLAGSLLAPTHSVLINLFIKVELRRNPIEDRAISGFSGQKSVPE